MDYSIWALLLLVVGILLLIAEVFVPSGGLISIAAAAALIGAVTCAWFAWWPGSPTFFWSFITAMILLLPAVLTAALYIWPSTSIGKRAILQEPLPEEVAPFVELQARFSGLVGKVGETVTALNPAGMARIGDERVHCQSEGVILDAGTPVRVLAVTGNRVIVRKVSAEELRAATSGEPTRAASGDAGPPPAARDEPARDPRKRPPSSTAPLDFDIG